MLEGYANTLPFHSVVRDASNRSHAILFPIALKYWTLKHGVENKVLDFYDDLDETSALQQIQKDTWKIH
jgi:hypothetical protein